MFLTIEETVLAETTSFFFPVNGVIFDLVPFRRSMSTWILLKSFFTVPRGPLTESTLPA